MNGPDLVPDDCREGLQHAAAMSDSAVLLVRGGEPPLVAWANATAVDLLARDVGRVTPDDLLCHLVLEHPSGTIALTAEYRNDDPFDIARVSLMRTARKIMSGQIFYAAPAAPSLEAAT